MLGEFSYLEGKEKETIDRRRFVRYGLGTCYMRMSKLQLAEYHFRKALDIYPSNAVLMGCVGLVSAVLVLFSLCSAED